MGLIQAAVGAAGGALADSWRDFFYCEALDENTLAAKGQKRTSDKGRSSNVRGESNIISDGSIVAVNEGQCMIIVESGEIVDVCAQPGQFVYDRSSEPSLFYGDLSETISATLEVIKQRLMFGGDTGKDQRVYYFNTKEIYGNKYGTSSPIPFRIVDANLGLDLDVAVRMNGEYSYRIVDPLLFYKNVCGNVEDVYKRDRIDSQLKSELLTALQPALARISELGIRYSAIPAHTKELARILNDELSIEWKEKRGLAIEVFGINSITMSEEDENRLKNLQAAVPLRDQNLGAAFTTAAMGDAMRDAANNQGGSVGAFMGMGMAQGMGANAAAQMYAQGGSAAPQSAYPMAEGGGFGAQPFPAPAPAPEPEPAPAPAPAVAAAPVAAAAVAAAPAAATWTCPTCGTVNTSNFCGQCGTAKPAPQPVAWVCPTCGQTNETNFCGQCGTARP